ncbi:hypothetical protein [Bradyrhizobium diversitatis]|uniref:Uncharacterized protein n=1 Tax=Bradyrhizobium diversitatis TaxID=2755406 RepID=A0ABS0PBI3_9BRAD|nr:hypothetical protein [Bradyrhizobium diversitatis]MBH5390644.1 hypothetical protein [Bradyrhizobium diversitatis]
MTISKGLQVYPRIEYLRRLAALKAEMGRCENGALVTNSSNITSLTGSFARSYSLDGLVVMADKKRRRSSGVPSMFRPFVHPTFVETGNVIGYSDDYVGRANKNGYDTVTDVRHQASLANCSVGIEFDGSYGLGLGMTTPHLAEKFKERLAKSVARTKVDWVRIVMSDLEVAVMRDAAAIADAAILYSASPKHAWGY